MLASGAARAQAEQYEQNEGKHLVALDLEEGGNRPNNNSSSREEGSPDGERRSLEDAENALTDNRGRRRREENSKSPNDFPSSKKVGMSTKKATKTPKKADKAGAKKNACSPRRGKRLARLVDEGLYNALPQKDRDN
jgi:hypothetical protein